MRWEKVEKPVDNVDKCELTKTYPSYRSLGEGGL